MLMFSSKVAGPERSAEQCWERTQTLMATDLGSNLSFTTWAAFQLGANHLPSESHFFLIFKMYYNNTDQQSCFGGSQLALCLAHSRCMLSELLSSLSFWMENKQNQNNSTHVPKTKNQTKWLHVNIQIFYLFLSDSQKLFEPRWCFLLQ